MESDAARQGLSIATSSASVAGMCALCAAANGAGLAGEASVGGWARASLTPDGRVVFLSTRARACVSTPLRAWNDGYALHPRKGRGWCHQTSTLTRSARLWNAGMWTEARSVALGLASWVRTSRTREPAKAKGRVCREDVDKSLRNR